MRYVIGLAAGCLGVCLSASAVLAGPQEDCEQVGNRNLQIQACSDLIRRNERLELVASAHRSRGAAYRSTGDETRAVEDFKQAIRLFSEAIRLNPNNDGLYVNRARAYQDQGEDERALADYNEAVTRRPREPRYYDARAEVHIVMGSYDRAIDDLNIALSLNARDPVAYVLRSVAYWAKGVLDRAVADSDEAIKLYPAGLLHVAYGNRGYAFTDMGQYDRALADLNEAIKIKPDYASGYAFRGRAYRGKREYQRSLSDLDAAIKLDPRQLRFYIYRAQTFEVMGDRGKAIEDYSRSLTFPARSKWERDQQAQVRQRLAALRGAPATALQAAPAAQPPAEAKQPTVPAPVPPVAVKQPAAAAPVPPAIKQPAAVPAPIPPVAAKQPAAPAPVAPAAEQTPALQPAEVAAKQAPAVAKGRRVALVIGNASYKVGPLENPAKDAAAVAEALEKLGFDKVMLRRDLTLEGFRTALREFARETMGADIGMVYYAGHGSEVGGRNFLIPVDANLARAGDLELEAMALDIVLNQMSGAQTLQLVILDACRNNVFPLAQAKRSVVRGLARIEPDGNVLVVYAAKHGTTADDGAGRAHSPFTEALLRHIGTEGLEIRFLFGGVKDDVMAATGRSQEPHIYSNLGGTKIYLHR
jgi:tetratricopeptide (TPR) repeat protein